MIEAVNGHQVDQFDDLAAAARKSGKQNMLDVVRFTSAAAEILGENGVLRSSDAPEMLRDIIGEGRDCILIARPSSTEHVAGLLNLCREHGVAVVPQGGNTNICHMAVPTEDRPSILLSLARMNRIIEINRSNATVTVEAGCIMQQVQEAVEAQGLTFGIDWGARGSATVGGAVSTNGGGLTVLRYGTTREQVLGLEVVLPDGRCWQGLRSLTKDNSGLDLKHIFIGSEGTLGVITRIVFRLHPQQPVRQSMMASLGNMSRLMDFFAKARSLGGDRLDAFELMPGIGVEKALSRYPDLQRPVETRADWYVLLRFAAREPVAGMMAELFDYGFEEGIISDAAMAQSMSQERNLWELREQMIPHQYFRGFRMLKWDVSVPGDQIVPFLAAANEAVEHLASNATCYAVGHVGDGNLHYCAFLPSDAYTEALAARIYDRIDNLIWSMDGSVVAEHGVGSLFRERVRRQKSGIEYELMQRIKGSIDPDGLMNPGKLLFD